MAKWNVNAVRLMLNEDCWLGINGAPAKYSGAIYRKAIVDYVKILHKHGMYAELSLAWGAPGTNQATYQSGGPDEDHAPAAWASLATDVQERLARDPRPVGRDGAGRELLPEGRSLRRDVRPLRTRRIPPRACSRPSR